MGFKVVSERLEVADKFVNEGTRKDGSAVNYYNLKVIVYGDSQIIGVPEDVYNSVEVGDKIFLKGSIGGLKEKYWRFNELWEQTDETKKK